MVSHMAPGESGRDVDLDHQKYLPFHHPYPEYRFACEAAMSFLFRPVFFPISFLIWPYGVHAYVVSYFFRHLAVCL